MKKNHIPIEIAKTLDFERIYCTIISTKETLKEARKLSIFHSFIRDRYL